MTSLKPNALIKEFFKLEASGGILLGIAAILALGMENSPLKAIYDSFLTIPFKIQIGEGFKLDKPLLLWINDGLMAIFFLLVGLEIKREVLQGQLSTKDQISLPAIAALGGLAVPALIYSYINTGDNHLMRGWAIPTATDIAFALGVITLLGSKVPQSLKITLVALAIIDDLAAILIIAIFYTENLSLLSLYSALIAISILAFLNYRHVTKVTPYMVVGLILWVCVLKSGVHATLAGVVLAFFIPLNGKEGSKSPSPLISLEHNLHPWVAYGVLPVFAFANAGVSLTGLSLDILLHPLTLAITLGLFFGKQIGVMLFTYIGMLLKICKLPKDVNWVQYYGMSLLTGIGFTMSLFIGTLAFSDYESQSSVRIGVILGSLLSGLFGYILLSYSCKEKTE